MSAVASQSRHFLQGDTHIGWKPTLERCKLTPSEMQLLRVLLRPPERSSTGSNADGASRGMRKHTAEEALRRKHCHLFAGSHRFPAPWAAQRSPLQPPLKAASPACAWSFRRSHHHPLGKAELTQQQQEKELFFQATKRIKIEINTFRMHNQHVSAA